MSWDRSSGHPTLVQGSLAPASLMAWSFDQFGESLKGGSGCVTGRDTLGKVPPPSRCLPVPSAPISGNLPPRWGKIAFLLSLKDPSFMPNGLSDLYLIAMTQ